MSKKNKTKKAGDVNKLGYWFEKVPELSKNSRAFNIIND